MNGTSAAATAPSGTLLNLYDGVSARVQTRGEEREASWYQPPNGFFPEATTQRWAHRREVWICYEFWARAKGVATGVSATEVQAKWEA